MREAIGYLQVVWRTRRSIPRAMRPNENLMGAFGPFKAPREAHECRWWRRRRAPIAFFRPCRRDSVRQCGVNLLTGVGVGWVAIGSAG